MFELMYQDQTNSSIAWKVDIHSSYLGNISTKRQILRIWGWALTIIKDSLLFFFGFAGERVLFEGEYREWPAFLISRSRHLHDDSKMSPERDNFIPLTILWLSFVSHY